MRIGLIGTGTIGAALVEGLQSLPGAPEVLVSPRSEVVSRALAERHENVRRAAGNAEAATADIVFLGMRPSQFEEAMAGISFDANQVVASMVAGLSLGELRTRWPGVPICRVIPMPGIARRAGPIAMYPAIGAVRELMAPLGDLFLPEDEAHLAFGGLNAFMSSYFELQRALIVVGTAAGLPEAEARRYVVSLLGMLADTARQSPAEALDRLVETHETPGGLNARVRAALTAAGWFQRPGVALSESAGLDFRVLG